MFSSTLATPDNGSMVFFFSADDFFFPFFSSVMQKFFLEIENFLHSLSSSSLISYQFLSYSIELFIIKVSHKKYFLFHGKFSPFKVSIPDLECFKVLKLHFSKIFKFWIDMFNDFHHNLSLTFTCLIKYLILHKTNTLNFQNFL